MHHRFGWPALVLALVLAGTTAGAAGVDPAAIAQVRFGLDKDRTRVVLDLTAPVTADSTILTSPDRLVIDLPAAVDWKPPATSASGGKGLVKGYRFSVFDAKTSHIVFDLAAPAHIERSFSLPPSSGYQSRFVVDLVKGAAGSAPTEPAAQNSPDTTGAIAQAAGRIPSPHEKPRQLSLTVMIDPGHGGADPGTIGVGAKNEKELVLAVGLKLRDVLKGRGYRVLMTRDSDVYPSLKDRVAMAHNAKADLFISLHADSNKDEDLRGASVYTLSDKASDAATQDLANKENKSDVIAGVDLTPDADDTSLILIQLTMRETMNQSVGFAKSLTAELSDVSPMLKNPRRNAGFVVLKTADVPSVLVELGQLANVEDEGRLEDGVEEGRIASAIGRAVDHYFDVDRRAALN